MRNAVRAHFYDYNAPFEGVVPYFYQDVKGLVTIGVGNLVDPYVKGLRMYKKDGTNATEAEVRAEWQRVKDDPKAAKLGHTHTRKITSLRMTPEGVAALVDSKLLEMEKYLQERFTEWEMWPADAQLGTLSVAWACGPAFRFPKFEKALLVRDWSTCAAESAISTKGAPGIIPRNRAQLICFRNAAEVTRLGLDPNILFYPGGPGGEVV